LAKLNCNLATFIETNQSLKEENRRLEGSLSEKNQEILTLKKEFHMMLKTNGKMERDLASARSNLDYTQGKAGVGP